jgi:hypothetical protein
MTLEGRSAPEGPLGKPARLFFQGAETFPVLGRRDGNIRGPGFFVVDGMAAKSYYQHRLHLGPGKGLKALFFIQEASHHHRIIMFFIFLLTGFILVPSVAMAWGPMTHMYLGSELLSCAPLLPAGILALIKKHKQDYLYGNLMADIIIGKKYLPDDKSSHSWDVGFKLLDQAKSWPERAFAYGYLGHLAADTVAHETLTDEMGNMGHTWAEMKADSLIDKAYWLQTVTFSRVVRRRSDLLLENSLDPYVFSFKTNRRIYKSIVFLSFLNKKRRRGVDRLLIHELHEESLARMVDLLARGTDSPVLAKNPL